MQRLTISVDDDLAQAFDELIEKRGYGSRSEAFRDLLRRELADVELERGDGDCVAVVSYAYDHSARMLSSRMVEHQHGHLGLVISTMHVHVDARECVEVTVMRGPVADVRRLAEETVAETGIENGNIHCIPLSPHAHAHAHPHGEHGHGHDHDHGYRH